MPDFPALIRDRSRPLDPRPTDTPPRVEPLSDVRAVLFDVYGTLVISDSGDVGTHAAEDRSGAFVAALDAAGLPAADGKEGVAALKAVIARRHAAAKAEGVDYPEVEIRAVWRDVFADLGAPTPDDARLERFAVEYECRTNPTWTMPHAADVLRELRGRGALLGIISNAQFFTPHLFPAHLGDTLEGFGFDPEARSWSYAHLRAKPGTFLYEYAAEKLAARGIAPGQVLYVGNDLLNDCTPAQQVGFRTALFAGDARSLRLREGDERVADTRPTVVVTDLRQLLESAPAVETGSEAG
ncbi:HAD family hydrolase [Alienimonas sp. DA493]|uniref:HAD family hydrolase n=1 Tax=Alienimonas sp. DA493 TaxID=3373605 RepID=UPI0037542BD5